MIVHRGSNQRIPEYHAWSLLCLGLGAKTYVELGCGSSHSQRDSGIRCVSVDLLANGLTGVPHFRGDSHSQATRDFVIEMLEGNPDVVFIDADHSAEAVRADFDLWYPVANLAVGFHDILMPSVVPAWRDISFRHPSVEIIARDLASADEWQRGGHHPDGQVDCGGIGVVFKI